MPRRLNNPKSRPGRGGRSDFERYRALAGHFSAQTGATLSFSYFWDSWDSMPFDDSAGGRLLDAGGADVATLLGLVLGAG